MSAADDATNKEHPEDDHRRARDAGHEGARGSNLFEQDKAGQCGNPDQWQRELNEKFGETFVVLKGATLRDQFGINHWQENPRVITSLDLAKRATECMAGDASRRNGREGERQKGSKALATLTKEAIRAHIQAHVAAHLDALLDGQLAQATGRKYLVTRDKRSGKFIRVGPAMASSLKEETIEVWAADPSTPAFTDLLNRAADKPAEQLQQLQVTEELTIVTERLEAARKRLAASREH